MRATQIGSPGSLHRRAPAVRLPSCARRDSGTGSATTDEPYRRTATIPMRFATLPRSLTRSSSPSRFSPHGYSRIWANRHPAHSCRRSLPARQQPGLLVSAMILTFDSPAGAVLPRSLRRHGARSSVATASWPRRTGADRTARISREPGPSLGTGQPKPRTAGRSIPPCRRVGSGG